MKKLIVITLLFIPTICFGAEYQTPRWQQRAITEYNYDKAIHNRSSETLNSDEKAPSWQQRAIDNYNYDRATHDRSDERGNSK